MFHVPVQRWSRFWKTLRSILDNETVWILTERGPSHFERENSFTLPEHVSDILLDHRMQEILLNSPALPNCYRRHLPDDLRHSSESDYFAAVSDWARVI